MQSQNWHHKNDMSLEELCLLSKFHILNGHGQIDLHLCIPKKEIVMERCQHVNGYHLPRHCMQPTKQGKKKVRSIPREDDYQLQDMLQGPKTTIKRSRINQKNNITKRGKINRKNNTNKRSSLLTLNKEKQPLVIDAPVEFEK